METKISPQAQKCFEAFKKWYYKTNVKPLSVERVVYSKSLDYAGTYDFLAEIDGKTILLDFKTGNCRQEFIKGRYTGVKSFYPEHLIQVGGYSLALREETDQPIDAHGVIYIQKDGSVEYFENPEIMNNEKAFAMTLNLHRQLSRLRR